MKTHLACGYKRVKVQTGSRVMDMLPSSEEIMTSEKPSDLDWESIWICGEELVPVTAHETEVCGDIRLGRDSSHNETFTAFD